MTSLRYPSDLSDQASYILFSIHEARGFTTKELQAIDKAQFTQSKIGGQIALPIPNQLQDSSAVNYEGLEDRSLLGEGAKNVLNATAPSVQKAVQAGSRYKTTKLASQNTLLFDSVRIKMFSFSWKLIPQNATEANNIEQIIKQFELAKLPYYNGGNEFLNFPDYFTIKFGGKQPKLLKFLPCVLTDMSVNMAPDGHFQMYSTGDFPVVELNMTFGELTSRTREIQTSLYGG